jgi:cytochrome c-type biogenesis protein CcmE
MFMLVVCSVMGNQMRDMGVKDVVMEGSKLRGYTVMVGGKVAPGSITRYKNPLGVSFSVADLDDQKVTLPVTYADAPPDTFKDGIPVRVQAVVTEDGTLEAQKILTQCPSKYQQDYSKLKGKD